MDQNARASKRPTTVHSDAEPAIAPSTPRPIPSTRTVLVLASLALIAAAAFAAPGWAGRMAYVSFAAAASALVARAAGFGAAISDRALARAWLVGAALAVVVGPVLPRFPNPYEGQGAFYDLLVALTRQAVLVAPVWAATRGLRPAPGAVDVALTGFAVGFGFDVAGALLAADAAREVTRIAIVPPFQLMTARAAIPGYAAWTAIAALAIALGRGRPALPIVVTMVVALDHTALLTLSPGSWLGQAGTWTGRGRIAGPLALIALAAASFDAVRRSERTSEPGKLARAALDRIRAWGRTWLSLAGRGGLPRGDAAPGHVTWVLRAEVQSVVAVAAVTVLFVLPKFPAVAAAFWSLPIVQTRLGAAAVTPLDALLIVLVLGRVLLAPQPGTGAGAAAAGDADTAATRFEGAVTAIALGLACALLVYPAIAAKTVTSIASIVWGAPPPPLRPTVVLLLAALATGITLERARLGLRAPIDQRRAAVVRNGSTLVSALTLMALAVGVYPTLIVTLHAGIGPALKPMFLGLYQQQSLAGFAVSNTIAVIAGVITGVACAGAAAVLRRFADATERFFVDTPGESLAERTA